MQIRNFLSAFFQFPPSTPKYITTNCHNVLSQRIVTVSGHTNMYSTNSSSCNSQSWRENTTPADVDTGISFPPTALGMEDSKRNVTDLKFLLKISRRRDFFW